MNLLQEIDILRARIATLEEEVKKEKAIRRALFELLPEMVWAKDISGKFIDCNAELAKFHNHSREELINKTDFDLYDDDRANSYYVEELNIIKNNQSFKRKDFNDGDWAFQGKSPIVTEDGQVIGTVGFTRKITNEIRNIEKVEEQRNFQRMLMDLIPDPIYMKDKDGHYTKMNLSKAKLLGVNHPREAIGKTDRDFLGANKIIENRLRELEVQRSGNEIISETEKIIFENGQESWYSTSIVPVFDGNHHINGIVGISRDITTQQMFMQTLSRDRVLFERLMDNLPYFIYFKDENGYFTRINKALAIRLNLDSPDDVVGKTDSDFFSDDFSAESQQEEQQIFSKGIALIGKERKIDFPNGDFAWISMIKIPIPDDKGLFTSLVGMGIDITQRKMAEEKLILAKEKAEENERLKSAFLSNISHEVRTPMNGIIGFTNLLLAGELSREESEEYLKHIKDCGHSLLRLFEDIIDISLIESGQIVPHITAVDLNEIMDELLLTYKQVVHQLCPAIEIEYIGEPPAQKIFTDVFRLRQIMSNLLDNAVKFTQQGKITFGVKSLSPKSLCFWVKDTGIGISVNKQKEIFEGYGIFKGTEVGQKNTGLGLPISYKLAKLLGGKLTVESQKGIGSTFCFELPFQIVDKNDSFGNIGSYYYPKLQNKKLLIIEEDETNYIYFNSLLNNSPIEVRWVRNSFDATNIILNEKIDVLLLDNDLLTKNKAEVMHKIKTKFPHLSVIVRNDDCVEQQNCIEIQHAFIQTPVLKEELMSALEQVL